jgi:magnesium chelatase subunit D
MDVGTSIPRELTITWAVTCCAAEPGLDGLLLFDMPTAALSGVASTLIQALTVVDPAHAPPRLVRLGSHENEDDLWSSLRPNTSDGVTMLMPTPGPLVRRADDPVLVVVVPDLAQLSLPANRAAITLLGSPVAELQRHGCSQRWPTGTYWVAACPTANAGQISEHLLDRFPVRLPAGPLVPTVDPIEKITRALADVQEEQQELVPALPAGWRSVLQRRRSGPPVNDGAIERAVALHDARHGMRRPLALLRLARATAWLADASVVTADHVDEVAVLTGLIAPTPTPTPPRATAATAGPQAHRDRDLHASRPALDQNRAVVAPSSTDVVEPVLAGAPVASLPAISVSVAMPLPYPEDDADPGREAEPLKLPWQRTAGSPGDRGPVVGTTPARSLKDIAWSDTVRHAALYQRFRLHSGPAVHDRRLVVTGTDLRSYRRAALPHRMLALLLDHTCRHGWDWLPTVAPYLRRAYSNRAAVCLVEVGGDGAPSLYRAERSMLRSLLDPWVAVALSRKPGGSTPLAHGLELVGQALRHALQHGAATLSGAEVVVVTDGLGNVPLDASAKDGLTQPVGGLGVADAIDAARALRDFDGIRVVVVQPPRVPHPEILLRLVEAISDERTLVVGRPDLAYVEHRR